MIPYVVYSHTEYLDVLKIQTDYLEKYSNKILLINKSVDNEIYNKYNQIIYYDDKLPYMTRLLELNKIDDDIFLFSHEKDIFVKMDMSFLEKMINIFIDKNLDRIDLKLPDFPPNKLDEKINITNDVDIVRQYHDEIKNPFVFNPNPALWRKDFFLKIHEKYKDRTHKKCESGEEIQKYASEFKCYKFLTTDYINVGHFRCVKYLQNFHITKGGRWYPVNGEFCTNRKENTFHNNNEIKLEYQNIIEKYNLISGKRRFNL